MKTILTIIAFVLSFTINAQTVINSSVSLTENSNLISTAPYSESHTNNCNIISGNITINGDLNLNGFILYVKQGTNLSITGFLNGSGEIRLCSNGNSSSVSICSSGGIQNNPNLNNISCSSLSSPTFNIQKDLGYIYTVFDVLGKEVARGVSNTQMYQDLPKNTFLVVRVEGFKEVKIMIQ